MVYGMSDILSKQVFLVETIDAEHEAMLHMKVRRPTAGTTTAGRRPNSSVVAGGDAGAAQRQRLRSVQTAGSSSSSSHRWSRASSHR